MTSFRRTGGSPATIRDEALSRRRPAAAVAMSFLLVTALSACGSPAGETDAGPASASVSPTPAGSASPDRDASGKSPSPEGGDGRGSDVADVVVPGRATTDVVPLSSDAVAVEDGVDRGLSVELVAIERVTAEASMPGEIAGSAVRVEVAVINAGTANHALGASVVNLYYGPDRTPASSLSGSGEESLPDSVPGGRTATGTYEFTVPEDGIEPVLVEIDVDPQLHVALFEGEISP